MIFGKYINRYYLRHAPTLLLGILFGTFSSVYVASPVLRAFGSVDMYCSAQKRNDDYERPGEHGIV